MKRFLKKCEKEGFTLLELLTVVAIIIVLAGLILSGMGYAQQKSASERARAEIAALSLAIEAYKIDFGDYPRFSNSGTGTNTNSLAPGSTVAPTNAAYIQNATILYQALVGDTTGSGITSTNQRAYFQFKADMLSSGTTPASGSTYVIDPFGYAYGYSTLANHLATSGSAPNPAAYNPTFDLWSTGGQTLGTGTGKWIKNW